MMAMFSMMIIQTHNNAAQDLRISWDVVWFLVVLAFLIFTAFAVYHLIQTLKQLRSTLRSVEHFLEQTDEVVRNLKSITYKLDHQLDDTGVLTSSLRKSVEEVSSALTVLGRLTGFPVSTLASLLGPILWLRKKRKRK